MKFMNAETKLDLPEPFDPKRIIRFKGRLLFLELLNYICAGWC